VLPAAPTGAWHVLLDTAHDVPPTVDTTVALAPHTLVLLQHA
jgi:hypothetical protein